MAANPKMKLTYFDTDGGRGESIRLALYLGGIKFEDNRISFQTFAATKDQYPFGCVPVMEVDGEIITQSNTMNRYIGRLTGLWPGDPWQAALCDETMDVIEDIVEKIMPTFFISDEEEKKTARQLLVDGKLTLYLQSLAQMLTARGGEYFSDGRLTVADLKVFIWLKGLVSGNLDYVPTDLVQQKTPQLAEFYQRIKTHEKIGQYYLSRDVTLP